MIQLHTLLFYSFIRMRPGQSGDNASPHGVGGCSVVFPFFSVAESGARVLRPPGAARGAAAPLRPRRGPRQGGQELEAAAQLPSPGHRAAGVFAHVPVGRMYVSRLVPWLCCFPVV